MTRGCKGSTNPNWTGDAASQSALHQRLRSHRGSASRHVCVDCGKPALDWSQTHGTTGLDLDNDYNPRCRSCHTRYDGKAQFSAGFVHRGSEHGQAKLKEEDIPVIRQRLARGESQRVIALSYDVHQVTISNVKLGRSWTHV